MGLHMDIGMVWCQPVSGTSAWSLVVVQTQIRPSAVAQAVYTIVALSNRTAQDINMASGSSTGHSHQVFGQKHGPCISTGLQVAVQTMDINMAFGGNMDHRHKSALPLIFIEVGNEEYEIVFERESLYLRHGF